MPDDRLHLDFDDGLFDKLHSVDAHSSESHQSCDIENCVVLQAESICEEVRAAQVRIGVATAIATLGIASIISLSILLVWVICATNGHPMPPIPWILTAIADSCFVAGAVTTLRLPQKARFIRMDK